MGKYKSWDEVPEKVRASLTEGMEEETIEQVKGALLRTANAEKAVVEKKGEAKEAKKESQENLSEMEKMQKQIDALTKNQTQSKHESFLDGKEISDEEKERFYELTDKGISAELAYKEAAKDTLETIANQENLKNNNLDGNSVDISGGTISADDYSRMAEQAIDNPESLKKFGEIEEKISSNELEVV